MSWLRGLILTLVLSITGAAIGAWGGTAYVLKRTHHPPSLHELIHDELRLTSTQKTQIDGMERAHSARRQVLEAEMRAANVELAQAFEEQHAFTPKVQLAIEHFHMAMGTLQKETMVHVLAMRAVLNPQQMAQFDDTVVKSLTSDQR
jgi:Spy/CpxP family protein refolding chaperone